MRPWENWYHTTVHTYGTWVRGDGRGWRARHHREHCEGDYKHPPPPGKFTELFEHSKALTKRDPVTLETSIRQLVLQMFVERLMSRGSDVEIGSLDAIHLHVLHQDYKHNPRIEIGIAKQYATAQLKAQGFALGLQLKPGEGLWQVKSHPEPIEDRYHFKCCRKYIYDHIDRGAVIWEPQPLELAIPEVDLLI